MKEILGILNIRLLINCPPRNPPIQEKMLFCIVLDEVTSCLHTNMSMGSRRQIRTVGK